MASYTNSEVNAQIRYAFWKETINSIYNDLPQMSPVAQELQKSVKKFNLSQLWLSRMIDSRVNIKFISKLNVNFIACSCYNCCDGAQIHPASAYW